MNIAIKKCSIISCKMALSWKADFIKQRISAVNIEHTPVAQLDRAPDF